MKQIIQHLSSGETEIIAAPAPRLRPGHLLIDTSVSLISIGTERTLVDFGRAGLIEKVRQQPEKVRQVLEKVQTDGLLATVDAVRSKLGQPIPLGYCNVGVVKESNERGFAPGDRVVSNGPHAEVVCVPRNLCAKIPPNVSDETAAFTILASIGLQGIRLANPTLGEAFVVTGVGLIGLLVVQMLRAQGCRVLAIDFDDKKLELAQQFGAATCNPNKGEDPVEMGIALGRGFGVDGVIITASTKSNDPVEQAAKMCRKRGRIILVGVVGLQLNRADFYEKELTFQVSCSYGPGRYDPDYEERGQDYPLGFVRWTEQRNFEAVIDLMSQGQVQVENLITHRFPFEDAPSAYDKVVNDPAALGILLSYGSRSEERHTQIVDLIDRHKPSQSIFPSVGLVGAGNYGSRILIPAFAAAGARLRAVASAGGVNATVHGRQTGFEQASSSFEALLDDPEIDTIAIATRHDNHMRQTCAALAADKNVFVEKPLALTLQELAAVEDAYAKAGRSLMVGYNRRFSPLVKKMKKLLSTVHYPKSFVFVMNAGAVPQDHWTQDSEIGGGRIIGEACHHIDLMRFLADSPIVSVQARRMGVNSAQQFVEDKAVIVLGFADGSFGTVHYLANGGSSFPKERIEVFAGGRTLQLDNFVHLRGYSWPGFRRTSLWRQDKGQSACVQAFVNALKLGEPAPIPPSELFEVARVTIKAAAQLSQQS